MAVIDDIKTLLGKSKPQASKGEQEKTTENTEPRHKILVVEDELVLQEMYKDKFIKEGFTVFTAENGEIGLKAAQEHKPDIILLDLMMPVMDGKTMLRRLREIPEFKHLPVIILTNAGGVDNIQETLRFDNACEFLIKSNIGIDAIVKKVIFWL